MSIKGRRLFSPRAAHSPFNPESPAPKRFFPSSLSAIQQFMNAQNQVNKLLQRQLAKQPIQLEPRDRFVIFQFHDDKQSNLTQSLQNWIQEVMKNICSAGFNYYSKREMTQEQVKIYCSENIIRNIASLNSKFPLKKKQLKIIQQHMKTSVLPYLLKKYPETTSAQANKKMRSALKEIDNLGAVENNFCGNSDIIFEYRQSGIYNDLIMRMINNLLEKTDSLYKTFENLMEEIFYQGKPKAQYTSSLFGKKMPSDTPSFTQQQIRYNKLTIKRPSVLRLLIKWSAQLADKFKDDYFSKSTDPVKVQRDGNKHHHLSASDRSKIDQLLNKQKPKIDAFVRQLQQSNFELQSQLLNIQSSKSEETKCGIFAQRVTTILQQQIIQYINKLIHTILKVSRDFYIETEKCTQFGWTSPPNLLTFKIGDMIRCNFLSKQAEVLQVYRRIQQRSLKENKSFKIVKIKDRLNRSTNDVLIIAKLDDSFLCEIQLAIKTKDDEFYKFSNKFNHYLYQVQRSPFDSLMQLCSIWTSLDKRSQIYRNLIKNDQKEKPLEQHKCDKSKMSNLSKRFICSNCNEIYFHNNYILKHRRCRMQLNNGRCKYKICAFCLAQTQNILVNKLIKDEDLIKICQKQKMQESKRQYGLSIYIESKILMMKQFKAVRFQGNTYYLHKNPGGQYELVSDHSQKQIKNKFELRHIVIDLKKPYEMETFRDQDAIKNYILPQLILKENYQKEKEVINLSVLDNHEQIKLNEAQIQCILRKGKKHQRQKIKVVIASGNNLKRIPFTIQDLPNLQILDISNNSFQSLAQIQTFHGLKQLKYENNIFEDLPREISKLPKLQTLTLDQSLKSINENFDFLQSLKHLTINFCILGSKELKTIFRCKQLAFLDLDKNQITQIPLQIKNLRFLEILRLQSNKIQTLPQQLFKLQNLKLINTKNNTQLKIHHVPQTSKIEYLRICNTSVDFSNAFQMKQLKKLGARNLRSQTALNLDNIKNCAKLQEMAVQQVNLLKIPESIVKCKQLKILSLKKTNLKNLPQVFSQLTSLEDLNLAQNKDIRLEDTLFKKFSRLRILNLSNNSLKQLPNLQLCAKLQDLDISGNSLPQIPQFISNLVYLWKLDISKNKDISNFSEKLIYNQNLLDFKFKQCNIKPKECVELLANQDYTGRWMSFSNQIRLQKKMGSVKCINKLEQMSFSTEQPKEKFENQPDYDYNKGSQDALYNKISSFKMTNLGSISYKCTFYKLGAKIYKRQQIQAYDLSQQEGQKTNYQLLKSHLKPPFPQPISHRIETVKLPSIVKPKCSICKKPEELEFPYYWLKWEQQPSLGCRQCVQKNIHFEDNHHQYAYKHNSILLHESPKDRYIPSSRLGTDEQPQGSIHLNNRHRINCTICEGKPDLGKARYICLGCNYAPGENEPDLVDLCGDCMKKYLDKEGIITERLEKGIGHDRFHFWLRVLYYTKSYSIY